MSAPPAQVVLYTRTGCHLCDQARLRLAEAGLRPVEVDIDTRPELVARFHTCVPVVEIDGKVRFRGRVEPRLLARLLVGRGPMPAGESSSAVAGRADESPRK